MSVTYEHTIGETTSPAFYPSNDVSEFMVEGEFSGQVHLQRALPSKSSWKTIVACQNVGLDQPLQTPDPSVQYRVYSNIKSGTATIYFGP